MVLNLWDNEIEAKVQQTKRGEDFKKIGEKVYSFFIDTLIDKGYEEREGQWDMSCEITDAMKNRQHILVEAGVGIGKTFAYIVPLLFYHKKYKQPIVIATSTIALQEQLESDIEVVQNIIGYHPEILLVKGQNHFLCRNRADSYFLCSKDAAEKAIYEEIQKGGCEKANWGIDISDKIWNQINVKEFNPIFCRQNCVHKDYCYYFKLRKELQMTNGFIVCNQDLLTINLRKRRNWNKEVMTDRFEFVVIDEAHNLESRVRSAYTKEMSYNSLSKTIERAGKMVRALGNTIDKKIKKYYMWLDMVFDALYLQKKKQDKIAQKECKEIERYYVDCNISALQSLKNCVHDIYLEVSMQFGMEDTYRTRDADIEIEELEMQEEFWDSMLKRESEDIFWMTAKGVEKKGIVLASCPKDVNELTEVLYFSDPHFTTILTSATITGGGENYKEGYKYFTKNTNFPVEEGIIAEPKISPFNYDEHAIIYYTEGMPHPSKNRKEFIKKGIEEIIRVLEISEGKALILFTAKSDMLEVYEGLKDAVPYKILLQKEGASQSDIIKDFKNDINSVLLGTGAYWEGISVEGISLSNLIIFKLPFPVPEPIIDYKTKIVENGLMEVLVPEMIIKLKQGIGRLIRSDKDFGIVSIIDSRVGEESKVPYKEQIWDALPIKNRSSDINKITEFYKSLK